MGKIFLELEVVINFIFDAQFWVFFNERWHR